MTAILKVDTIQDTSGNNIINESSDTITIGASGDIINAATGTKPSFLNPSFEAFLSAKQDISDLTTTKVQFNTEVFDSNGCYDNSTNYRFTPTVAGKYFVFAKIATDTIAGANLDQVRIFIYKNGSSISIANLDARGNTLGSYYTCNDSTVVDMNGSSDYLEIFARIDDTSGDPDINGDSSERLTSFGAYRIGT